MQLPLHAITRRGSSKEALIELGFCFEGGLLEHFYFDLRADPLGVSLSFKYEVVLIEYPR